MEKLLPDAECVGRLKRSPIAQREGTRVRKQLLYSPELVETQKYHTNASIKPILFRKAVATRDKPTPRMIGRTIGFTKADFFTSLFCAEPPNLEWLWAFFGRLDLGFIEG